MISRFGRLAPLAVLACLSGPLPAHAEGGFLERVKKHVTVTSTVAENGDQNPYAVVVAPVSAGLIHKDDVLIDNFNNATNLQGLGTTIVIYDPATRKTRPFAALPRHLTQCPGGVGLTTAMIMLKSGWVIVGSTPSEDGTTATKGPGCLIVLDPNGKLADVWSGPDIDGPWGNMAIRDDGASATLFISMAGFDVPGPQVRDAAGFPVTVAKATVLRLTLSIPNGGKPAITGRTVVANGFGQRSDPGAFLIGPTGLVLAQDGTLYVSDALGNRIVAVENALTRPDSAGTGREITQGGMLNRPLALIMAPNGHLLAVNGRNGQVVEIDPAAKKQLYAQWIDANQAQSPPGSGDLFGLAVKPDGSGFYYVEDEVNALVEAK
ncbi:MAG TPA: hypothetical protein VFG62_13510 [Rhodopila sp.]|nr:hypothetical protein [Rhodopila sp.]